MTEAERAWERWVHDNWITMTAKESFLAGFEAGIEAGKDLRDAQLAVRWKPPSTEER